MSAPDGPQACRNGSGGDHARTVDAPFDSDARNVGQVNRKVGGDCRKHPKARECDVDPDPIYVGAEEQHLNKVSEVNRSGRAGHPKRRVYFIVDSISPLLLLLH
jgi:hypothetical protein